MGRLLRDACAGFLGIGECLSEGFGWPLVMPSFEIQYIGKMRAFLADQGNCPSRKEGAIPLVGGKGGDELFRLGLVADGCCRLPDVVPVSQHDGGPRRSSG